MPHDPQKLITDILMSIDELEDFSHGKSFPDFEGNALLQRAVEREFEIIGEALNRLIRIDEERLQTIVLEYRSIIGMRNILAHSYDVIDPMVLWDVVKNHIPILKKQILHF